LDLRYKIHADSDQVVVVAKFQGDRSRELGERWAKKERKKENVTSKTEDLPLLRTGGLINEMHRFVYFLLCIMSYYFNGCHYSFMTFC